MKPLAHTFALSLTALGLASAAISPAMASPALASDTEPMTVSVRVADLDLTSAAGQRALDRRMERAVRSVCAAASASTGSRIVAQDAQACIAKTRASVRDQVAALTAAQQRGG